MQNTLLVLLGPTGVGKTDISVDLASHLGTEIISCDSRQFYVEMTIGTAIPSEEQLKKVQHHFIKFLSVKEYYSASLFERDVLELLPSLFSRNNLGVMTGGSGMYIDAVCNGIDDIPDVDPAIRQKYSRQYEEEGLESLRVSLKLLDPLHYSNVDLRNPMRIIRALEICETTGRPYSAFLNNRKRARDFRIIKIGLRREREELYERINRRVDTMISLGLEAEAKALFEYKNLNALNTVGYKEFFDCFEGKISKEKAIELIKQNSRRYAKRQMTWWARDKEIRWFHPDEKDEIHSFVLSICK
jgi:tRNA dimethylallyltransferase